MTDNMGTFWREITGDSQLRWIGPDKGAIHLATAAIVNAVWDMWAKREGKPVWKLLVDMTPEQLVRCLDFCHRCTNTRRSDLLATPSGPRKRSPRSRNAQRWLPRLHHLRRLAGLQR